MNTVQFDSVQKVYGSRDRHHPAVGSRIEEAHPMANGFLSTAVLCKAKSDVVQHNAGIINPLNFEVENITLARVNAIPAGWVGAIGASADAEDRVWVVVNGIWQIRALAVAAQAALYTSGTTGALDDAAGGQTRVFGVFMLAAKGAAAGTGLARLAWPSARS